MMNLLWGGMLVAGILTSFFYGRMEAVSDAVLASAKDAVALCITMLGMMSLWTGLVQVAKKAGLLKRMEGLLSPLLRLLFPDISKEHPAREYIVTNLVANILGLGWAATPAGLRVMQELQKNNPTKESATVDMCTFLIINISSLQLIPVNIIAYRSQYQSLHPTGILLGGLIATGCSTAAGILFSIVARRVQERKG